MPCQTNTPATINAASASKMRNARRTRLVAGLPGESGCSDMTEWLIAVCWFFTRQEVAQAYRQPNDSLDFSKSQNL